MWLLHDHSRPSRLLDQHFGNGIGPEDVISPLGPTDRDCRVFMRFRDRDGYPRSWSPRSARQDAGSTVTVDKDAFQAHLDVKQFAAEELKVKATGSAVVVEGKHEEKEDDQGFISRHFVRRYVVPEGYDIEKVESKLSSDGVLTIIVPKIGEEEKNVPVHLTGRPCDKHRL